MQAQLNSVYRVYTDRIAKELSEQSDATLEILEKIEKGDPVDWRKPVDFAMTDQERSVIDGAAYGLLGNVAHSVLSLIEELAGDIGQDITTWKPPLE